MTDILELADANLEYINDLEGSGYFVTKEELIYFASLLREKFIAELEQTGWQFYQDGEWFNGSDKFQHKKNTIEAGYQVRELYALHKDKD